jgi:hypothetical protein
MALRRVGCVRTAATGQEQTSWIVMLRFQAAEACTVAASRLFSSYARLLLPNNARCGVRFEFQTITC